MPRRMHICRVLVLLCLWACSGCTAAEVPRPAPCDQFNVSFSDEEARLYRLVNQYRQSRGLATVPASKSLTRVAQLHARDLEAHPPRPPCNMHSWSQDGPWSSCCYTPNHAQARCMWHKPQQLTPYQSEGYEIAAWYQGPRGEGIQAREALKLLSESPGHNAVMLNQGQWQKHPWLSTGVGVSGRYAVIWYGAERDVCGAVP